MEQALFGITQEALNNIIKHARATLVQVSLQRAGRGLELRVRDNGRGFDPALVRPGHLGLDIIRERAEALHMRAVITSHPGGGTELVVRYQPDQTGGEI